MPELYDNVRRANSQYVPQFVGSTANELKQVGDVLQERYTQNQNELDDKLALAINEEYAPGDEQIGVNIFNDLSNLRDKISSSDQSFENSSYIIRNAVRDKVINNRDRIEGLRNKKQYDLYQAQLRELGADAVDLSPEFKGTKNEDGTYNRFIPRVEKRLDYDKRKETFFNQFEQDLTQGGFKTDAKNPGFLKSILNGGITDQRILNYKNQALERYKGTSEYQQEFEVRKREAQRLGLNPSNAQIDEEITNSILATGLERVHKIRKEDLERIPEYMMGNDGGANDPTPLYTPTSPTAPAGNSYQKELVSPTTGEDIEYDEKTGKYYKVGIPQGWKPVGPGAQAPVIRLEEVPNPNSNEQGTALYQFNKLKNQDPKLLEQAGIKDFETYVKAYDEAKTKNKAIAVQGLQIDPEQAKIYDDIVQRNLFSSEIYIEGNNKGVSAKEAGVEFGNDGKPKVQVVKIVPTLPNSNLEGGGAEVLLLRDNNTPIRAFVRLNDSFTEQTKWMNRVLGSSTFASQDLNDISNPLINDDPYSIRMDDAGNTYQEIAYTLTVPTPSSKRAFTTKVVPGVRVIDSSGNTVDLFDKEAEALFEDKSFKPMYQDEFQAKETLKAKQRLAKGVNAAETLKKKSRE